MVKKKAKKRVAKKGPVILPRKMSSLIKIALRDIRKAEALPDKFVLDMSEWFKQDEAVCRITDGTEVARHKVCVVCAAGSVMAFTLKATERPENYLVPELMPNNSDQLRAINELREGNVLDAAGALDIDVKLNDFDTVIPEYDPKKPEPFHKAMTKLQEKLQKAGY